MQGTPDISQLRHLLFGKDYDALLALKAQFENSATYSASVASVIAEALQHREAYDGGVSSVLAPTVERAMSHAISSDPKRFADVLYPVMGPAIRKSIQQALNEALENFNQLLEQSLSVRSWRWRFDAWRTGQSYAQIALLRTLVYQVEQVFLIHRDTGLLLQHVVSENVASKDPEIISGMLTAIQDFIKDSFATTGDDTLDTLRLGELTVLVEHGPHAVLAAVVRGSVPSELRVMLIETSETIHQQYATQLETYNGDATAFSGIAHVLNDCLVKKQQQHKKRPPWLAYLLLASLIGALGWWIYQYQQAQAALAHQQAQAEHAQQATLQALRAQLAQQQTQYATVQTSLQTLLEQQTQQQQRSAQQIAADTATLTMLTRQIETARYPFEKATADVHPQHPTLIALTKHLNELLQTAHRIGKTPQVMIIGNADDSGTDTLNRQLAQQRADNLRTVLIASGVPAFILVAYGAQHPGLPSHLQKNERSTHYRVSLY
ncbi:MAG: OmpA family protein [Candidatus Thiothrix putei]|uniref:OmpA family protein n=1 Tax=Candidatus Thiothrix putei TaxID=3080811 RepID=A0AA95HG00_9GAMM|nr:MAG: OmpA family protein [Candidatus Thiothrix putei]